MFWLILIIWYVIGLLGTIIGYTTEPVVRVKDIFKIILMSLTGPIIAVIGVVVFLSHHGVIDKIDEFMKKELINKYK
jgi:hypothetical protein